MSDDPNTAAELFADDIMRIVMSRLSVRLQPNGNAIAVLLVDNMTGFSHLCTGEQLTIDTVVVTCPVETRVPAVLGRRG